MNHACVPADEALSTRGAVVSLPARIAVILCMLLAGCGGNPAPSIGFINQTQHTDADLWALWQSAQQNLSEQIDLNPLEQELNNAAPNLLPGDVRALNISPHQLVVSAQPDISAATLDAATGTTHSNPTGLIACPQPCNVNYAPAYSIYSQPTSRYAASWEFVGNNFDSLVEYEFENQILNALGYDMRWR